MSRVRSVKENPVTMKTPDLRSESEALRVAMCQVETGHWDVTGNLDRTLASLQDAGNRGAQLAITPENVIQGYPPHASPEERARLHECGTKIDGPELGQIGDLASEHAMDIVVGFTEKTPHGTLHNSCAYIDRTGKIIAVYRKVHCRPFEDAAHEGTFVAGDEFMTAPCAVGDSVYTIGLYICFDREIPESTRCLRAMGAHFIACPLATNTSRLDAPLNRADNEMLTRARAAENELFIAVVNHSGSYNGGSFLVGPSGECLLQMDEHPGVAIVDVPVAVVPQRFHSDPLGWAGWGHRRPSVYSRHLERASSIDEGRATDP